MHGLPEKYRIGKLLKNEQICVTYSGVDEQLGRKVLIKGYHPDTKEYFRKEVMVYTRFSKIAEVLQMYDFLENEDMLYLILEYPEGRTLGELLAEKKKLSCEETLEIMLPLLNGLSKIYESGMIYGNMEPDNVLITENGMIRIVPNYMYDITNIGIHKESPVIFHMTYAAPELYSGGMRQGGFIDVYSAGAMMYEMLTGRKPPDVTDRIMGEDMDQLSKWNPNGRENLEFIIQKAMALQTKIRYQTAEQFCQALVENVL